MYLVGVCIYMLSQNHESNDEKRDQTTILHYLALQTHRETIAVSMRVGKTMGGDREF